MGEKNPGYVYACGWNRFNLAVIGGWPEEKQNFMIKNLAWVHAILIFMTIYLPQTASLAFLRDDLSEFISCLTVNVPIGFSVFKIVLFRLRREALIGILSSMAKDWSMPRTKEEENVMSKKAEYGRFISIMSVSIAFSLFIVFAGFGVISSIIIVSQFDQFDNYMDNIEKNEISQTWASINERKYTLPNETRLAIGFLYPSYFPFDTNELRVYLPLWFSQLFSTIFSLIGYSGLDSLMAMMILHLCGQLATVRIALTNIVNEECSVMIQHDPGVYWKRLSLIVEKHEELNRYGATLEESFNLMLLMQMVLCTITFCFQGFAAITTLIEGLTGEEDFPVLPMAILVIHGSYTILHFFVSCWVSDLLVLESTALSYASYDSDWFLLPPTQAKGLMMVTHRSKIPLQITAGKFVVLSLEIFTAIMKTSMGYLSVLLAMKDD